MRRSKAPSVLFGLHTQKKQKVESEPVEAQDSDEKENSENSPPILPLKKKPIVNTQPQKVNHLDKWKIPSSTPTATETADTEEMEVEGCLLSVCVCVRGRRCARKRVSVQVESLFVQATSKTAQQKKRLVSTLGWMKVSYPAHDTHDIHDMHVLTHRRRATILCCFLPHSEQD